MTASFSIPAHQPIFDRAPGLVVTLFVLCFAKSFQNLYFKAKAHSIMNIRGEEKFVEQLLGRKPLDEEEARRVFDSNWGHQEQDDRDFARLIDMCHVAGVPERYFTPHNPLRKLTVHRAFELVGTPAQKLAFRAYFDFWRARNVLSEYLPWYVSKLRRALGFSRKN